MAIGQRLVAVLHKLSGSTQKAAGEATGDPTLHAKGEAKRTEGHVQSALKAAKKPTNSAVKHVKKEKNHD